jgi:hypothetical protein
MKTSTRINLAVVTTTFGVVAFFLAACPHNGEDAVRDPWTLTLKIHGKGSDEFLEVKDKDNFNRAMCAVKNHGGDISTIRYQPDGGQTPYPTYDPCISPTPSSPTASGGDPNATQHVRANSPGELKAVLDAFAEPSATPGH